MSSYDTIQNRVRSLKKSLLMHGGRLEPVELEAVRASLTNTVAYVDKVRDLHEAGEDDDPFAAADKPKAEGADDPDFEVRSDSAEGKELFE